MEYFLLITQHIYFEVLVEIYQVQSSDLSPMQCCVACMINLTMLRGVVKIHLLLI